MLRAIINKGLFNEFSLLNCTLSTCNNFTVARGARPLLEAAPKLQSAVSLQKVCPSVSLLGSRWMGTSFSGLLRTPIFATYKPTSLLSRYYFKTSYFKSTIYTKNVNFPVLFSAEYNQ